MSQELITQDQGQYMGGFPGQSGLPAAGGAVNVGSVSIEQQRAVAEAQGQLILAKKFPRDLNTAYAELMDACKLPALAEVAFYSLPRGKSTVSGPSIRLAEEIARVYGNFQYGHRELSRDDKKSEVEVYAWDMEKNNYSKRQLTVMHVMDTKDGPRKLRDQKDIDDKIANVASKQVRGRILALVPKWLSEAAIAECRKTLAGANEMPIGDRVRKMTQAFAKFGVTTKHLEVFLSHSLDDVTVEEIADLQGVFNAIKDGQKISDFFGESEDKEANTETAAKLTAAADVGNQQRRQAAAKGAKSKNAEQTGKAPAAPAENAAAENVATVNAAEANSKNTEANRNPVEEREAANLEQAPASEAGDAQQPDPQPDPQSDDSDVF